MHQQMNGMKEKAGTEHGVEKTMKQNSDKSKQVIRRLSDKLSEITIAYNF